MIKERNEVLQYEKSRLAPVVDTTVTNYNYLLNPNSYQKGAWVLHMLRWKLGYNAFVKGVSAYYKQFKFGNALTKDFQKAMEKSSGQNLHKFFDQWIMKPGHPALKVDWKYKSKTKTIELTITQTQEGQVFQFPLELSIYVNGSPEPFNTSLNISKKETKASFQLENEPEKIVLDPDVKLLFSESK
jgi:aminopeptidase N